MTEEQVIALLRQPEGTLCEGDNLRVSGPCGLHAHGYTQDDPKDPNSFWAGCEECLECAVGEGEWFIP